MRECTKCHVEKKLGDFPRHKPSKDGFGRRCKECKAAYYREWRKINKARLSEYSKDWRIRNLEKDTLTKKKYYQTNKKSMDEASNKWKASNKDRWLRSITDWRSRHFGIGAYYTASRRAAIKTQTPLNADMDAIKSLYVESAVLTIETEVKHEVDHIIPIFKGGLHHQDNMQVITRCENNEKRVQMPWDFYSNYSEFLRTGEKLTRR